MPIINIFGLAFVIYLVYEFTMMAREIAAPIISVTL